MIDTYFISYRVWLADIAERVWLGF